MRTSLCLYTPSRIRCPSSYSAFSKAGHCSETVHPLSWHATDRLETGPDMTKSYTSPGPQSCGCGMSGERFSAQKPCHVHQQREDNEKGRKACRRRFVKHGESVKG